MYQPHPAQEVALSYPLTRTRRSQAGSDGFTLLELSIAMGIFSILAMLIMYTLNGFVTLQNQTLNRFYATSSAQNIIDQLSKDIRTAITPTGIAGQSTPFVSASPTSLTFYANLGGTSPTEIHAYATPLPGSSSCPCQFHEDVYQNGAWTPRVDGGYVVGLDVFSYFTAPTPSQPQPALITIPSTGTTNQTTLSQVAEIGINISTSINPQSPLTTVNSLIEIRNVAFDPTPTS